MEGFERLGRLTHTGALSVYGSVRMRIGRLEGEMERKDRWFMKLWPV